MNKLPQNIDEKLFSIKCKPSEKSHLEPNQEHCSKCANRVCEHICPAGVYCFDEKENRLSVKYENCLECGACRISCTSRSIKWNYPDGGYGITYKNS